MSVLMQFLMGAGIAVFGWRLYGNPTKSVVPDWWWPAPNSKSITELIRALGVLAVLVGLANVGFALTRELPDFLGYLIVLVFSPILTWLTVRPVNHSSEG